MKNAEIELANLKSNLQQQFIQHALIVSQKKWWAYKAADQYNITNATDVTILFDQLYYDCDGAGFSSNGYPVTERGLYLVLLKVMWFNTLDQDNYMARILVNAVVEDTDYQPQSGSGALPYVNARCCAIVPADVGDVIYGIARHNDGTNNPDVFCGSRVYTNMIIHLLSRRCF